MPETLHIYRQTTTSTMRKALTYTPIEYYTPIINGWIASDLFLNQYEPKTGKTTSAGFTLASIYFLDMVIEHHMRWKQPSELKAVKQHLYYHIFVHMKPQCVSKKQYCNHNLFLKHPVLFEIKYRTIGMFYYVARLVLAVKPIQNWCKKRKFPLTKLMKHT